MPPRVFARAVLLAAAVALIPAAAARAQEGAPLLLQQPAVSRTQIAFVYGGDLWIVGRDGGGARRLTTGIGEETDPHFSPEHDIDAHRPSTLLLFEADEPDHAEDVTGWAGVKLAALLEHRSQHRSTMHIDPDDDGTQLAAFRKRVLDRLAEGGARAGVEHAELFKAITEL